MQRRLSALIKPGDGSKGLGFTFNSNTSNTDMDDDESKVSTLAKEELQPLGVPSMKVKRVDYFYSRWTRSWKYRNMAARITIEAVPMLQQMSNNQWKDYSIVLVRTIPQEENLPPTFKVVIRSEYIVKACKDVIQTWPGISWNYDPLELEPEILLTFFNRFTEYRHALAAKLKGGSGSGSGPSGSTLEVPKEKDVSSKSKALAKYEAELDGHVVKCVDLLLDFLKTDYKSTLTQIRNLISHGEMTFDLLYSILVPRSLFVVRCAVTGLERVLKMTSWTRACMDGRPTYVLVCESVDLVDRPNTRTVGVGKVETTVMISAFRGTVSIQSLSAYPIEFHHNEKGLRERLLKRGKKWVSLIGVHHKQFNGVAALKIGEHKIVRHNVNSRVMIDRATFRRLNANYAFPTAVTQQNNDGNSDTKHYRRESMKLGKLNSFSRPTTNQGMFHQNFIDNANSPTVPKNGALVESDGLEDDTAETAELDEEDLMLTSTTVFGFSLSDKTWLQFNVEAVQDVNWNQDAFANLVLPPGRKQLLQSLVEAHHRELGFDDFIRGKGHGLVVNLFGPPGVGKTFSAEATAEHVNRPLYLIGAGDLGTDAADLDSALERIFDVATAWKAIVLIDEADVFLEQRSLHDLERNAMVAVFLRHVEYYRGILFLTTNRVKTFDEAFLSRIHVALHFDNLSLESKEQIWRAFIKKVVPDSEDPSRTITEAQIGLLAKRNINGRQIKNATRTAHCLAVGRGERLGLSHFVETLDAMAEFEAEFAKVAGVQETAATAQKPVVDGANSSKEVEAENAESTGEGVEPEAATKENA